MRRAAAAIIVLGALGATGTTPALAVPVSASATLSEFQVSVEDVIPDDGIAPSLTVLETSYAIGVLFDNEPEWDGMPFVEFVTTPGVSGQQGKLAEPGPPPHAGGLFAEGRVDLPDVFLDVRSRVTFQLLVGIGTRVTITSTATASTSIEDCPLTVDCFARAAVTFASVFEDEILLTNQLAHGAGGPRSISDQESRALTFEVETDDTGGVFTVLSVSLVAQAWQTFVPDPVPEPSTTALLALGLVLVGAARPRRARGR